MTGLPLDPQLRKTLAKALRATRGKASLGSTGCRGAGVFSAASPPRCESWGLERGQVPEGELPGEKDARSCPRAVGQQ